MTRRLTLALVGLVAVTLVLVGVGTMTLASLADRRAAEAELRDQAEALSTVLQEVTIATPDERSTIRARLRTFARTLSLEGVGLLVYPPNGGEPLGELPEGVTLDEADLATLQAGGLVSGRSGDTIWAAAGGRNRLGLAQVLVLTRSPDPILGPAVGWFLVAGAATLVVAGGVAVVLGRSLTRPVRAVADTTRRLAAGDLSARVGDDVPRGDDELGRLVTAVDTMAAELQRARALERQFLLSISHDLRTPLTSIRGWGEALADGAVDDPVQAGRRVEAEARRLERLVTDLLLLARLESRSFDFTPRRVDAGELVADAVAAFEHEATERGVEIGVEVPAHATPVLVDPDRYAQIVTNLVGNACRFADHRVRVVVHLAAGGVHLAVGDDGPGIADEDLPHVFERLYVATRNPKVAESGSGLGLAIVRELTEAMGGRVVARRSALGGAEFVVSFPVADAVGASAGDGATGSVRR
ncbi:MAG: HAMP domain-containing protein [Actinomyces sp.]|nr:MAG: HAMP domain-containing protein [Actinomyces sp.]